MTRIFRFFAALAFAVPAVAQAQDKPAVVGSWTIDYEAGRRMENDVVTSIRANALLTITQDGDSLIAALKVNSRTDGARLPNPTTFGGKKTMAGAVFTQKQQVRMNRNGEESTLDLVVTWTVSVDGTELKGTIARSGPGLPEGMEPATLTGKRAS